LDQCCDFKHHLLCWEIVWRNAPCIWQDFGSVLRFQTRLTQTKPVLPLSNEHGSQVKDLGRRQCCHNKHKKVCIGLHVMYLYFPDTPGLNKVQITKDKVIESVMNGEILVREYKCLVLGLFTSSVWLLEYADY
jgi:hypothetical protein